ncbi:MAG TPA: alpha-galactosidase [Terracidiphilus sp.]|nr:alpha-galactosidase [Terracidiphilus sp.]
MSVAIDSNDGSYAIGASGLNSTVLRAGIAAEVDGRFLQSASYPKHTIHVSQVQDEIGSAKQWEVSFSGLANTPGLAYRLRLYAAASLIAIQADVHNDTDNLIHVASIRLIGSSGPSVLNLGGPANQDRILSDSFSEDVPPIRILDLADADRGVHRAIGSQLIYNRASGWSFFAGTISADRFLTILRLHVDKTSDEPRIAMYEVDSTGTTEITKDNSLAESPAEDRVTLSLVVAPGESLSSEQLELSIGNDYHRQLEAYGELIRRLRHARTSAPVAMGWWSWTAYYYGLTEGAALTNAQWLSQHLKTFGYTFFHLDEGYQYARGEYTTPDAALYPHGVAALEDQVRALGLTPGIWTAPFEVSERSSIYRDHQDWLVRNAAGTPIHLGWANSHRDRLYVLDTTNPDAQQYLRQTYKALVNNWGIRYIKLDFMDDSAVEGIRYRPGTSALQAQKIGLEIIRSTVGERVLLDKDGSSMLAPVGYVDYGRIAQDTGHTFEATREAAPAMAARYYMNRNFFVSDPDAFTVSTQTVKDHAWNGGKVPLTLDEAEASIALSAVSGGMFEIGDDLPTLGSRPERIALVQNPDLLAMVSLGKASIPIDLMSYLPGDDQPCIFFLKEDARQSILTTFNWTDRPGTHTIDFSQIGLDPSAHYEVAEIFNSLNIPAISHGAIVIDQPAHSARMYKIINSAIPAAPPAIRVSSPSHIAAGATAEFSVTMDDAGPAAIALQWDFGDGVRLNGVNVKHAFTQPGAYQVTLDSKSLDGQTRRDIIPVVVDGVMPSTFEPQNKVRLVSPSAAVSGQP